MIREFEIKITPDHAYDEDIIKAEVARIAKIPAGSSFQYRVVKRSLDARHRPPMYVLRTIVSKDEILPPVSKELDNVKVVSSAPPVHIIGAGPAGYFAAIECIRLGLKPIVFDRGKDVQGRRRDLRAIQQKGIVNPHSNYCFGEGGAGTYSDGKLYTRSGKRGNIESVLKILVECGADPGILIDAHPHIGSNKLPHIIAKQRAWIEAHGGQVIFNAWMSDLKLKENGVRKITAIEINQKEWVPVEHVILATGHSARDIFQLLFEKNIAIEAKPFALGVRIEHAQSFIDECQYGISTRGPNLPAASYALNSQYKDRGIFSFCMCPGGLIVPAATAPGEIVVNGMSLSRRDSAYANSGVVTSVELSDMASYKNDGPMMGVSLQRSVEQAMFSAGDGTQAAPAQMLTDFMKGRDSTFLGDTSYIPGIFPAPLHKLLPSWIYERLRYGITGFDHKMKGYIHPGAIVVATESRTSSPVRIPRDASTGMHIHVEGLYPCGEGAGYAGGIVSAAMDGQAIARLVARRIHQNYV